MSFKKIGLWGVFCFISLVINSQVNFNVNKTVEWFEPITIDGETTTLLQFSSMGDLNPETEIPLLTQSIKLPPGDKPQDIKVSIVDTEYIWPTPKEHSFFENNVDNEELEYNYSTSRSGQCYFLDLSITPVIKPKGAPSFKKLVSYTINITYNKQESSSLKGSTTSHSYAENSVLDAGKWIKVGITKTGIHKITYSKLKDWGISNPQNIGIYGNGGKMLPASNDEYRYDDLVENAIWNNNKDAVYFFAEGPVVWSYDNNLGMFIHEKNNFSDYSYYFITEKSNASRSISESDLQSSTFKEEIHSFNDYNYHEEDDYNLLSSGNVWFGQKFNHSVKSHSFDFNFPNTISNSKARVYSKLIARSGTKTKFELFANETSINTTEVYNINTDSHTSYEARDGVLKGSLINNADNIDIRINFNIDNSQSSSIGYLDYLCVNVERELEFVSNELLFRNINTVDIDNTVKYNIKEAQDLIVWDITNPLIPLNITTNFSGTTASFNYEASDLKEFAVFNPAGNFPSPSFIEEVENQNLHASPFADYIIVCHPDFLEQANRLGKIHNEYNGMSFLVVTTEDIYNEYSSGKSDVTAIRSFVKMLYDKAGTDDSKKPKNLLLFGDGSYDNRQGIANNTNKIPTYQSDNSIHNTNSFVSDDYFGLLDSGEGHNIKSDKVDIGIGRFPVNTREEANNAVDKTYKYYYEQSNDQWKSNLTFIGDDGDNNIHMTDANSLTTKLESSHPEYNISKLYFDAYEKITTTTGHSIPEIEEDIFNSISKGTLVLNYTGHGGPDVLAHERIITRTHINSWNNIDKLALFVTATCEFSRYDNNEHENSNINPTAGEEVFLNPLGGGIALYTTTRIVYSSLNKQLNTSFYNFIFERDKDGNPYTLGEIMMHTKNGISASVNKLNFSLLGDPAIRLIYPKSNINTSKINDDKVMFTVDDTEVLAPIDSLKALSKIKVNGVVTDGLNKIRNDFNGEIFISVFDKQSQVVTRGNNGASPFTYKTFENIIFKGPTNVVNGQFESEFVIPKDIRYNFDKGKISYYAYSDDDNQEAFGAFSEVVIGGINADASEDDEGPKIDLWLNNKSFTNGATVGSRPILLAEISDESGINTTGNGIGHDMTCVIDEDSSNPIILNNDFEAEINSYQAGTVSKQLSSLETGEHTLTVKVWDTHNNSSTSTINFSVDLNEGIDISENKVFPNPIKRGHSAYISFRHEDPNARLDIQLLLYNMSGQLISQQNSSVISLINTIPPIEIKTETSNGSSLDPGIYLYKLVVISQTGRKGEVSGKIMVAQ